MPRSSNTIDIYLEIGEKRAFAGAIDWPGWCRIGRDEESAVQSLFDYAPRYARILHAAQIAFQAPAEPSAFVVVERLTGNKTTDFGAPGIAPTSDTRAFDDDTLRRFQELLTAAWQALDAAMQAASGKQLRTGPRGGGRDLERIVEHVVDSSVGYLAQIGWKRQNPEAPDLSEQLRETHQAVLDALAAAAHGELPTRGPRGGVRWSPRYFVRRLAWHVLDHVWEIEDRIL